MMTKHHKLRALTKRKVRTAIGLLTLGAGPLLAPAVHAADPYDKSLEQRVEALERELNTMSNDSKGKNVTTTEVPTFVRAAKNVQELVFSGELRLRNEYSTTQNQVAGGTTTNTQADRNRFRFRLFADYKLNDDFFAGAAVQTALASDSGNTTISEGFDNYALYLWRFFIGWHTKDDKIKLIAGKQPNPFYEETEMLWDADISPIGLTEQVKFSLGSQFELSLIAGQFAFQDNPENAFYNGNGAATQGARIPGGDNNQDAYLAYQQLLGVFKLSNKVTISAAGGYLFYPGHGGTGGTAATPVTGTTIGVVNPGSGNAGTAVGAGNGTGQNGNVLTNSGAFNSPNATRNLSIGTFNGDVKLDLGKLKLKVYGQAAYNFKGGARVQQEYATNPLFAASGGATANGLTGITSKTAFSTGFTLGSDYQIKKNGDYVFLAEYRQVGLGSVDPNLNDSDWNFSRLGFRGIKIAGSYGFRSWLIGTVTYFGANNLGSERNLNFPLGNYNASHIVQFDLTTKF